MKNEEYVQDMAERYIYQVARRLPAAQRDEIKKELQGLIEDMLAERTEYPGREDINAVLQELGNPRKMADKYREARQYLIGPEYFGMYIFLLKIVLGAVALGMTIALSIGFATSPPASVAEGVGTFASSVFMALLQAFAWLTLGLALADRFAGKQIIFPDEDWRPSELPPVPAENVIIKRSEPIASMIFIVIVMVLFNAAPQLFSVYVGGGYPAVIPLFNLDKWAAFIGMFNLLFALGLVKEAVRLLFGRYNVTLAISVAVINIVSMAMAVLLFGSPDLWNPNFVSSLQAVQAFGISSAVDVSYYFELAKKILTGLIVLGYVVDTITVLVRGIRCSLADREE